MTTQVAVPGDRSQWNTHELNKLGEAVSELQGIANGGSQTVLPASNGVDDTAAIQAILDANSTVAGKNGESYKISAPLVLRTNATLDMRGCTVTLIAGNAKNMLNNTAVAAVRRFLDAVTTATSTTLTSATAAFVAGDVGKAVTIQGAGTAGAPHTTTIASVTNGTTAVLTLAAVTTVSGQYAALGARDSNITVIGGLWDRGANGDTSYNGHVMRFRHVDGLTIIGGPRFNSSAGKYGINPGDCTRIFVDSPDFTGFSSDGVHLNGPCAFATIRNVRGTAMHDDLVSLTARDSNASITDCAGDITDVDVDCAKFASLSAGGFASVLKLVGGKTTDSSLDYKVLRFTAKGLTGPTTGAANVFLGDTSGGIFDDILIEDVRSLGGATKGCVQIHGGTTVDRITLRDLAPDPADSYAVSADVTIGRLDVAGVKWTPTSPGAYVVLASGALSKLLLSRAQIVASNGGALVRAASGSTITAVQLTQNTTDGFAGVVNVSAGGAITTVNIDDLVATTSTYPLGIYAAGTTTLEASNVNASGMSGWLQTTGGTVSIIGVSGMSGDNNSVNGSLITGGYLFGIGRKYGLAQAATLTPDLLQGEWVEMTVTTASAIAVAAPINAPPSGKTSTCTVTFFNNSGGAMALPTFNGNYQLTGGAFTQPATTKRRWIKFQSTGNGSTWVEIGRAAADY